MKRVYMIIGIPGSGKDTQGDMLSQYLDIPHIGAGKIFSDLLKGENKFVDVIREAFRTNQPVPTTIFMEVMSERFQSEGCQNGFVLTVNTKSVTEAELLLEVFKANNLYLEHVFYLYITRNTAIDRAIERLQGVFTAKEPNMETLVQRIDTYIGIIDSIVNYYQPKKLLTIIDGEQNKALVFQEIIGRISANFL